MEDGASLLLKGVEENCRSIDSNMAFVGYVESVSNLYTSEIRSMWLADLIDDKFKLQECLEDAYTNN
ncbi:flavin containing monooxygenase, putative [Medicago truncatula]|uniref:Flavin containing monooxygenase, putative n=2 Tax=Medicago truncatula TaxID=3880 RepID=A0A072VHM8_MEDTR|nr:flavin containing monooxygenase, putative [Medicago truncatula]